MASPVPEPLVMWGSPAQQPAPDWAWVEGRLTAAPFYWVDARGDAASAGSPHPRPVWGVWDGGRLFLSLGTPVLNRRLGADPAITVHLESALDVVIVNGRFDGRRGDADVIGRYDAKYDWHYDVEQYGPLVTVEPVDVLAWRAAGVAGRDGFAAAGRWHFG